MRAILIGAGATVVLDLWGTFQKRVLGIPPLDYRMVGRWIGHFRRGRFVHDDITVAAPVPGERVIGWTAHYLIGIAFAALLLAIRGLEWAHRPTFLPALGVGIATVAAPFFILQPGLGAGVAASKTPEPGAARLRSLAAHAVYGAGLYVAAWVWAVLIRP